MAITINAKGTSVSDFTIGKNGTNIDNLGVITPPNGNDLTVDLASGNSLVVDTAGAGPALITASDSQDLHINPAVGGGQHLLLNAVRWPTTDGTNGQVLQTNGAGILSYATLPGVGTVTDVSVQTANGLAGSVATSTSTPAITLTTTVNGVLKGNGTAISAASSGDITTALGYTPADIASPTFTGDPKAPTPALSDNDTSIATTAYVQNEYEDGFGGGAYSFKNQIINGNFVVAQRGSTQTGEGYGSLDHWYFESNGSTKSISQQSFTTGQTDVPGNPEAFVRYIVTSVAGANNFSIMRQPVENVRTFQQVESTLSFWAKADSAKDIAVEFKQNFGSGGSAEVNTIGVTTVSLTTSWQKFTITLTLPSISGKTIGAGNYITAQMWFDAGSTYNARTNSLGQQSGTFDIAQVQWEEGSVATPFEKRPIGLELSLCQRYYEFGGTNTIWSGDVISTAIYYLTCRFATPKRVSPTVVATDIANKHFTAGNPAVTSVNANQFWTQKTANASGSAGYYQFGWTAESEL